ncbi:MAG: OmpA family protein [Bacteroidia bacterium]
MLQRFLYCFILFISLPALADEIKIGTKVPDIVLKNTNNEVVSLENVNKNKLVLVHFWSPGAMNSRANHTALNELAATYKTTALNGAGGFEIYAVGLEKLKESWEMAIQKDQFTNATHVLDVNGLFSLNAKKFKVTSLPADFLIDQDGKLIAINPSLNELKNLLKKYSSIKPVSQLKDILAKLLYGDKKKMPLVHQKVFLLSGSGDTLKTAETDDYGDFSFKQVNVSQQVNLVVDKNENTAKITDLYLAQQNGQIVSKFTKTASGFEYRLLPKEIHKLTEMAEAEDPGMKMDLFSKSADKIMTITENIYYPSKEFKIVDKAAKKLDAIVENMKKNDKLKLEIYSHTDSNGEDSYNLELSNKRANAALEYMVSKGIDKKRIKAIGMGEAKIMNRCSNGENCSEKEHELNRRTEFRFSK